MLTEHVVVNRPLLQRDLEHIATGGLHGLLHRHRHFPRLALAHADSAVTVTNHGQRCKAEDATTLHDFGNAVDRDHLLAQTVITTFVLHAGLKLRHCC
jgi:hypothetical protein